MAITIKMGDDGILRMHISGDMDNVQVKNLQREITPFLEASTPEHPLNVISTTGEIGKVSFASRKYFAEINKHPCMGLFSILNPPRVVRILGRFIIAATKRDNIKFFSDETEAIAWIKSQ